MVRTILERVCLLHTRQIKVALGISGIMANIFSWHIKGNDYHSGVQIDLLIDRADNVISVCEMKYAPDGYEMTSKAYDNLKTKMSVLGRYMPAKKIHITSPYNIQRSQEEYVF